MQIDPHTVDFFLAHSGRRISEARREAKNRPIGQACPDLTVEQGRAYVHERLEAFGNPLRLAMMQEVRALEKGQAEERNLEKRLALKRLENEKRIQGFRQRVLTLMEYLDKGDPDGKLEPIVTEAAEKIIADVTPANFTPDSAAELVKLVKTHMPNWVKKKDAAFLESTTEVIFERKQVRPFTKEQIGSWAVEKQQEMLSREADVIEGYVVEALDFVGRSGLEYQFALDETEAEKEPAAVLTKLEPEFAQKLAKIRNAHPVRIAEGWKWDRELRNDAFAGYGDEVLEFYRDRARSHCDRLEGDLSRILADRQAVRSMAAAQPAGP